MMATCDLCGKNVPAGDLEELLKSYRSPGIVDICHDCGNWATKRKFALMSEASDRLRVEIMVRKRGPLPRPWWHLFWRPI